MTLRGRDLCHDSDEVHPVDLDACLMDTVKAKQPLYDKILSFFGYWSLKYDRQFIYCPI
jgi:hypothetical protein